MTEPRPMHWDRDGQPISLERWAELIEHHFIYRMVARTDIGEPVQVAVSTVWIGIDYSFGDAPRPLIFETMVFGGPLDQECRRTPTVKEAMIVHDEMVALARAELDVARADAEHEREDHDQ